MRCAVIWARFGPYHLARLKAAAARFGAEGGAVAGIEAARSDGTYEWDVAEGADGYERVTLFPDSSYEQIGRADLIRTMGRALDRFAPDVVAVNGWGVPEAQAAHIWTRRNNVPSVVMTETKLDDIERVWWREVLKARQVRRFGAALAGGAPHRAYLERLGFPPGRIFLGYDAVDNAYFAEGAARVRANAAALRAEYALPENYFFACTRFIERKNVDGLLRAYAAYRAEAGEGAWGLVVAGGGEEMAGYQALVAQLGLQESVIWPGFVQYDALPVYFGLAGAFIHPAKAEPWGLVLNEAAASGLPVLSSRTVGSAYELVEDGRNGLLFDPDSDADIQRALTALAGLPAAGRAEMGAESERIVADWGPERFASGLMAAAACAAGQGGPNG